MDRNVWFVTLSSVRVKPIQQLVSEVPNISEVGYIHWPTSWFMLPEGKRLAFVATEGLSEPDLVKSVRALEQMGFRVDVIGAKPYGNHVKGNSSIEYCALALSVPLLQDESEHCNQQAREIVESTRSAGKPVLYVPVSATLRERPSSSFSVNVKRLAANTWQNWLAINAPRLGASLAYYTLLSLAPLLVLIVSITGLFFKRAIIQGSLTWQVEHLVGDAGASIVSSVLSNAKPSTGIVAGALSILMLGLGASGVFMELRDSLDIVWGVKPTYGTGLLSLVRARTFAFLTIFGTGLGFTVFLLLGAILATPARFILHVLPMAGPVTALITASVSLVAMTLIFALIYKTIPDVHIHWSDVWVGALVTSMLFTAGKWLIGIYLGSVSLGSPYAAAGSLVIFLTWVYYSAQIFLLGAEFTHVYTLRHGSYSRQASRSRA